MQKIRARYFNLDDEKMIGELALTGTLICRLLFFLFKINFFFSEKSLRNTMRVPNSLDPDQARRFVGLDLGPYSLQRLLAGDTGTKREKEGHK